jgi:AAHS family 4-hydroxybenzoate transporter-like MFS transporter
MNTASSESVFDAVDDGKLSGAQAQLIALCALIALLDGFDTQAIGFVAPVIAAEWALPLADFGLIFAVGLVGGLVGAISFGAIADRIGRRATLLITVTLFALGSLLTAIASNPTELVIYRAVTGLGLGGAMPSLIALTSEYSPKRMRTMLVTAMFCGFPLGAVIGAILSAPVIEMFGWTWVFIAGGALPLLLLPAIAFALPESLAWLHTHQRRDEANAILARMRKLPLPAAASSARDTRVRNDFIASLFGEGRAIGSLVLGATFFVSLLLSYLLVSWLPSIAVEAGLTVRMGVISAAVLNLSGVVGSLIIGLLSDRAGAFRIVGAGYVLGALSIVALVNLGGVGAGVMQFAAIAGLLCIGAQMCLVSVAAQFYPAAVRGAGVGWCMGIGRFGAIAGPLIGATLVASEGASAMFLLVAGLSGLAGLGVIAMSLIYRTPSSPTAPSAQTAPSS